MGAAGLLGLDLVRSLTLRTGDWLERASWVGGFAAGRTVAVYDTGADLTIEYRRNGPGLIGFTPGSIHLSYLHQDQSRSRM